MDSSEEDDKETGPQVQGRGVHFKKNESNVIVIDVIDDKDTDLHRPLSNTRLIGRWKMPLDAYTSGRVTDLDGLPKKVRSFYQAQNNLITEYEHIYWRYDSQLQFTSSNGSDKDDTLKAGHYAKIVLIFNMILIIGKMVAVYMSESLSIISSLVDSLVDLLSGILFLWTAHAMSRRDPYLYPQGRRRLEPISIVILSVIMSLAALQLIQESIAKVVLLAEEPTAIPTVEVVSISILGSTIAIKLMLYMLCRQQSSPMIQALSIDQRNDVLTNTVAIVGGYIGSKDMFEKTNVKILRYLDPTGAFIISIYIFVNWWKTGYTQIKQLTGHTAKPEFLSKIIWTALTHDKNIKQIDTARAFYFGSNFLVEVDIILPENMLLKEAHDIGESLQQKLECIQEIERAFVHLDFKVMQDPKSKHKDV